ncbi:TM0106 family RecB-like putative nuclease [Parafrigoribacterium mesophilum]
MRKLDAKLGRVPPVIEPEDDMLARTAILGDVHEHRLLEQLRRSREVVEFERPSPNLAALTAAAAASELALGGGADVLFQPTFFDGRMLGFADFIMRLPDGRYEVYDAKLARHAKITALLQVAAYSEQLQRLRIPIGDEVHLLLGDGSTSTHRLRDILPVYRKRRIRLQQMVDGRVADPQPTPWGDTRYTACGRCAACAEQIELHRDVLLVAGMRPTQRAKLADAGVRTIEDLAVVAGPVAGMTDTTLATLSAQAALQLRGPLAFEVFNPTALTALPAPDDGDIFFDFEGDPLFQSGHVWGLDYLFGLVEPDDTFRAFWAHSLAEEAVALAGFLDYVAARRARHPGMHIYHYASYERTHLLTIAARHGVGEEAVDDLLRNNVLVDLYPIVRRAVRVGNHSYSLKKLEPLYMGDDEREGVANAADSIIEYVRSRELLAAGDTQAADVILQDIARYNAYDCRSTLRLRNWLLERAREAAVEVAAHSDLVLDVPIREPDPVYLHLSALLPPAGTVDRTPDGTALALAAAAIDYHRREQKTFWWEHFRRLTAPVWEWADQRDVLIITEAQTLVPWHRDGRQKSLRRILRVSGSLGPGSSIGVGAAPFLLYDVPYPPITRSTQPGARTAHNKVTVLEVIDENVFVLEERLEADAPEHDELPMAFTPATPPPPGTQVGAISQWGADVLGAYPRMLRDPAFDILRRQPPNGPLVRGESAIDSIRDSLLALKRSYLAVQGPPGTGKTYTGSRVIAQLVARHGWKVGVVAQSHAAVENMLTAVLDAGLDPSRVGKKPKQGDSETAVPWTSLKAQEIPAFAREDGFVLGGTAWDFSNPERVPRGSLDLLVIDEAGQFSLASTIAASVAAQRLLLLGDPQQLPQVSQGTHPEPVDDSALGWLSDGHNVLPDELGFFLACSWRMHPQLCAAVSQLAYEGKLASAAAPRLLESAAPGLHPIPVRHWFNSTSSAEEADRVVEIARSLLGRDWTCDGVTRPLQQGDVIVVAPYNAQVELIRQRMRAAGMPLVPVGTVDKFQGQEAAVSIVSLAASSAAEVPRGLEFLLLPNRLNVAISRAQWAAYLLYSPALTEYLPTNATTLAHLSAFINLVEPAPHW